MNPLVNVEHVQYRTFKASSGKPATAGGVEVEGRTQTAYGADFDEHVMLSLFSVDAVMRIEARAEDIERAAALLTDIRRKLGDYRGICAFHGYQPSSYSCTQCDADESKESATATPAQPPTPMDIPF